MRKSIRLLLILLFLTLSCIIIVKPAFSSNSMAENSWVSKASMHEARGGLGVVAVNGKIYAIGGSTYSGLSPITSGFTGTNEEYDLKTDAWTIKASMPTPRARFAIAAYQNKIYCIGGTTGYSSSTGYVLTGITEVYDPETDTWETKASMPTARDTLKANVANGKIYLIGGYPGGTLNEVYDPETDSWTTKASAPTGVSDYASAVVDDEIFVIGVFLNPQTRNYDPITEIYDSQSDKWSLGSPPPSSVTDGAAVATTGVMAPERIYVLGVPRAYRQNDPLFSNQIYEPENDSWTSGAAVPTNCEKFGVAVVNDILYAIGGHIIDVLNFATPSAVNEQYTPFGYGTIPPVVTVFSPENSNYTSSNISLAFALNKPAVWLGYSLDGMENVTISGNTTLSGLSNGPHNITVYAKDKFENTGISSTISFSVEVPFPTTLVTASIASLAVIGVSLLVYFKRRKR
jgi:N-acetylneuraminic acid mutarotase